MLEAEGEGENAAEDEGANADQSLASVTMTMLLADNNSQWRPSDKDMPTVEARATMLLRHVGDPDESTCTLILQEQAQ